jgi:hypothetical protein
VDDQSSVPLRELKAFSRVTVARGSSEGIALSIPVSELSLVDVDGSYKVLEGVYDLWLGGRAPGWLGQGVAVPYVQEPLHTTFTVKR